MIPKVIHRLWLGGPEPEWTRPFRATWDRPGWKVVDWDERRLEQMPPLVNQDVFDRAEKIAPDHVGQLRSDVLRYEILWRYGGVYVDTDLECLKPLDPLLDVACFAGWEVQDRWVGNTILGAVPEHPFIGKLIGGLRGVKPGRPNRITGPHHVTRTHRATPGLTVYPQGHFYPYGWDEIRENGPGGDWPDDAFTVHHWANQRREKNLGPV